MNDLGLTEKQKKQIQKILMRYPAVESVRVFGSRAKGNFTKRSDLDLVAFGKSIDRFIVSEILLDFDDLDVPFRIELQNHNTIKNQQLKEHIKRVGVEFYRKKCQNK